MSSSNKKKQIKPAEQSAIQYAPFSYKAQLAILGLLSFAFYFNSLFNEYAFDDAIVIEKNEYVQMGIKGIPKILSNDAYASFYSQMGAKKQELSGGRYRPLSIITFAIENEFVGDNSQAGNTRQRNGEKCWDKNNNKVNDPEEDTDNNRVWNETDCRYNGAFIRHLMNVLLYTLSVLLILFLLRNHLFKHLSYGKDLAFLGTLIFAIHPIHTEVVANVKSRDEILSLIFITLTFIQAFKYLEKKQKRNLFAALSCFFLALLSKEYAIVLLLLLPLSFYIIEKINLKNCLKKTLPFMGVFILYLVIRIKVVGAETIENTEILNNPYLFANSHEKIATKLFILLKYFLLLLFPHPLSSDYSFNEIPYRTFGNIEVWISILLNLTLILTGIIAVKKRHLLGFAIFFYFAFLLLVSNLVFDIGATMGERLVYHSSLGFSIGLAFIITWAIGKIPSKLFAKRAVLALLLLPIILLSGFKVIERNKAWENDISLFTTDVKTAKNSVLANGNAGARYIDLSERPENKGKEKELLQKAIFHLEKSIRLHPKYVNGYLNLGLAYFKQEDYANAEKQWLIAKGLFPSNPNLANYFGVLSSVYLNKGYAEAKKGNMEQSIQYLEKVCQIDPNNADSWYNLGGGYFTFKNYEKAKSAWQKTLELNPNHEMAKKGLAAIPK